MKKAKHGALDIANEFILRGIDAGRPLTPMEVQKMMYFAHGWMLAIFGRPLHTDAWRAWQYGPVLPRVYHKLRNYRGNPIQDAIAGGRADMDADETYIVDEVFRLYSPYKGIELSAWTHVSGSPWEQARSHSPGGIPIIYDAYIKDYFEQQLRQSQSGQRNA